MGFMTAIGFLWILASLSSWNQRRVILATAFLALMFIISPVGGLLLDGFDQQFTYFELSFEVIGLAVILIIYFLSQSTPE